MRLVLCAVYCFMGALLFAVPNMTRRELLFAVPVPPDFRDSSAGRRAIASFRAVVGATLLAGLGVLLLSPPQLLGLAAAATETGLFAISGFCFFLEHRTLAPFAVQYSGVREAELTTETDRLPRFAWLGLGPFALFAAAFAWLQTHWESIPLRFPVHYGANGVADGWSTRTFKGVYGPLLFGIELCVWFLILGLAGWYGARRARWRPIMMGVMISAGYLMAAVFGSVALMPLLRIPVAVIILSPMAILIPVIIVAVKKMSAPSEPMDPTPNDCWKAGIFYYNPNDAALFVEKRDGLGYTFNFANRWAWGLLISLMAIVLSAPFLFG